VLVANKVLFTELCLCSINHTLNYRNADFVDILTPEVKEKYASMTYDLVANIVHDGEPGKGTYRVHVLHKVSMQQT
jgi:hypothetical protein